MGRYKDHFIIAILICLFSLGHAPRLHAQSTQTGTQQPAAQQIVIATRTVSLILNAAKGGRLYQSYLGKKMEGFQHIPPGHHEAYATAGMDNLFEPAIRMVHADGNPSLELGFVESKTETISSNVSTTSITLKDPQYPVEVILHFTAFYQEDVIRTWTEIRQHEKKEVVLTDYASSMLNLDADKYWLTQFHGDWAKEVRMQESQLTSGIKIIDSKLGSRANIYQTPMFFLSLDQPATENEGEVLAGTLAWTGSFQFKFEIDERNSLRILTGINPYASDYKLRPGETFTTPEFIFTWTKGKGQASRNLHQWARNYGILAGNAPRLTLLNNWETTYFDFNEPKLENLFDDAARLGVDVFLLDDGWFANKYPRNNDRAGLGDWEENKSKLPNGIAHLVKDAEAKGVKFGIWIEPEMVNPKSELYEKHPDWILKLPNRPENYYRNQLVLDLLNPKVQDFVFDVVDGLFTRNPGLAYIKWDCNRLMTNAFSPYLKNDQSALYIDYTRSLYKVLERIRKKYPLVPMMLCSGGGGRTDYAALRYFTEFWPSDNTDPLERIFIQWGYSYFFPALAVCNHITSSGKESLKFRTDVAMMGKMGYDINVRSLSADEMAFSQQAVKTYKRISEVIWKGDLYRLISPYEGNRAALLYATGKTHQTDHGANENSDTVQNDQTAHTDHAILFTYNLHTPAAEKFSNLKLEGLDPQKQYTLTELNIFPGGSGASTENGQVFTGEYLMKFGLKWPGHSPLTSAVFELTAL
ncbi:MAG TPA: alpha-galactosidase [Puia sp.]|nr:alpha-galactosidase [Puia sp.]